jgi:hypothetical protein
MLATVPRLAAASCPDLITARGEDGALLRALLSGRQVWQDSGNGIANQPGDGVINAHHRASACSACPGGAVVTFWLALASA